MTLTNWGLIISCLSFLQEVYGSDYFPYVALYGEMGLPVLDGMITLWTADMEARAAHLKKKQTDEVKSYWIHKKSARVAEQQEHEQWAKRQQIQHSYGMEDGDDSDDSDTDIGPLPATQGRDMEDGALLVVNGDTSTGKQTSKQGKEKAGGPRKSC